MDQEPAALLHRILVDHPVDEDRPHLRIVAATIDSVEGAPVRVSVVFDRRGQRGTFVRPFDSVDVQMLTDPTPEQTALAFATWVRLELLEHISDLIASGDWPPSPAS